MIDPEALGLETFNISDNEIQTLCPFHDDHKPSASFNMKKGLFYCYACGTSMNAKKIALELGGDIVELKNTAKLLRRRDVREWRPLLYAPQAIDHPYLQRRKVTNGQVRWYDIKELEGGVGFPLTTRHGTICGMQERKTGRGNNGSRYILHGSKPEFWPSRTSFASEQSPLLVEGVFGVLRLERARITAYATLSSQITSRAARLFNGRQPLVWFDNDYAGVVGAAKLVISCNATAILAECPADDVASSKHAKNVMSRARRTQDLEELAGRSGSGARFWKHIKFWRRKYDSRKYSRQ